MCVFLPWDSVAPRGTCYELSLHGVHCAEKPLVLFLRLSRLWLLLIIALPSSEVKGGLRWAVLWPVAGREVRRWPWGPELRSADPGLFEVTQHTGRPFELWTRVHIGKPPREPGVLFKKQGLRWDNKH